MTIGIYDGHEFLIKDIKKVASLYACADIQAHFTKTCHLQRHSKNCAQGKTVIICPNERVEALQTTYERVFYGKLRASASSIRWLERASKQLVRHIHHALCGHGGEQWIEGAAVDGHDSKTNPVFQYYGCRRCFLNSREEFINHGHSRENRFLATATRMQALREAGYSVIEKWECEVRKTHETLPQQETKTYPHAIFYDFESWLDKSQRNQVTKELAYKDVHVPITVSIGDTLEREPTHTCDANKKELIKKFMAELERCSAKIRAQVKAQFMSEDSHLLTRKGRRAIAQWCDQVPVLWFNSGRYDLNLIKDHFVELLANITANVQVGKNANTTMFMKTSGFCFVDLINYLGPPTTYDKWVKAS